MSSVPPVERRTYFPVSLPEGGRRRACPACGRETMVPWHLRRDGRRRVWRRWVCDACLAAEELPEDDSA